MTELLESMKKHVLSNPDKIKVLRKELFQKEKIKGIDQCENMGEIVDKLLNNLAA